MSETNDKNYIISTLNYILKFKNEELVSRERKQYNRIFEYLSKYIYVLDAVDNTLNAETARNDTIWQCWLQGKDDMPKLVATCTNSVKSQNPLHNYVLITEKNYGDYISIPEYILEKYKKNIIPKPQFSDILRLMLLQKYGGIWIDSTIYETGKLPEEAFTLDFFSYKNTLGLCFEEIKNFRELEIISNYFNSPLMLTSTWFLSASSNNIIIRNWLNLLLEYWKNENKLIDYYLMDYMFVLLLLNNSLCRNIFKSIPTFLTTPVFLLQAAMPEEFDKQLLEDIKSMTPIHKLTRNYTPDGSIQNRMYYKIVNKE